MIKSINNYALFMGYMSMAVKGLGYLVVLWTTVILLGGFVSVLGKKDFWCLTIITLLQIGISKSNAFLNVGGQYILRSLKGFFSGTDAMVAAIRKYREEDDRKSGLLGSSLRRFYQLAVIVVQWLVFAVILCPLVVLYSFGMFIITGLSVWRLTKRDFGEVNGGANLNPSLKVVYSIVLFQSLISMYRDAMMWSAREGVATAVIERYGLNESLRESVMAYLRATMIGCRKDPSFVKGRNLVTYAIELTRSGSPDGFLSGARILASLVDQPEQHAMIKQLVVSASSSEVLHKLLQALDYCTRPNDAETRECAATIVAHLAGDLRLEQFPGGIQCIASLLDGPREEEEEEDDDDDDGYDYSDGLFMFLDNDDDGVRVPVNYKKLMSQGLLILGKLAAHEDCRKAIIDTEGLLTKIMAPLQSGLLHVDGHNDAWSSIVYASMEVMRWLVTAPPCNAGQELRSTISGNTEAMDSMERILKCEECSELLLMQALEIYTQLREHTLSDIARRTDFIRKLVCIFTQVYMRDDIRGLAGEKLVTLSSHGKENATIILQAKEGVIADLTKILVQDDESNKCKIRAAQILEQLCIHHSDDDEYLKNLKEALNLTVPKVLAETLVDKKASSNLLATVLSLCATMLRINFMSADDLVCQFDAIISGDAGFSFLESLKQMITRNSHHTVSCLKTLKLTIEIFLLMVRHGCRYTTKETDTLMDSLAEAAEKISDFEGVMVISGTSTGTKTLNFLLKEAKEELQRRGDAPEMEVVIQHIQTKTRLNKP